MIDFIVSVISSYPVANIDIKKRVIKFNILMPFDMQELIEAINNEGILFECLIKGNNVTFRKVREV